MIKKTISFLVIVACLLAALVIYSDHVRHYGQSRVSITGQNGETVRFVIPNKMIDDPTKIAPVFGDVDVLGIDLSPGQKSGASPRYWVTLKAAAGTLQAGNAGVLSSKREIKSEFPGYRQFDDGETTLGRSFYLAKDVDSASSMFIRCSRGAIGELKKCTYWGRHGSAIEYTFSFPGDELGKFESLVDFAESRIAEFIEKDDNNGYSTE